MVSEILKNVRSEGRRFLLEPEANIVCKKYGVPVTKLAVAKTSDKAVEHAERIGYPVALKIVSPNVIHKFDVGGVFLDLKDRKQIRETFQKILENVKRSKPGAKIVGVAVQEMAPSSTEVIIGATKDLQFGQTLVFGLGGIFVEVLKDVTFKIAPIMKEEANEMITEKKAYQVLKGYRGQTPADIDAIVQILVNVSRLVMDYPEIKELDLNPVMIYDKGAKTVDARIILEDDALHEKQPHDLNIQSD